MSTIIEIPRVAIPSERELRHLPRRLKRELAWHADSPRHQTDEDVEAAIEAGTLTEFTDTADIARIRRFDIKAPGRTPYLMPAAHRLSRLFGHMWRRELETHYGVVQPTARLAITSMVRSQAYQDTIVAAGGLAWPDSTHCTGYTFDIDASGYYELDDPGQLRPAIDPRRSTPNVDDRLPNYDPRITQAAIRAARTLHRAGVLNCVSEFAGTPNACLHLSAKPDQPPIPIQHPNSC